MLAQVSRYSVRVSRAAFRGVGKECVRFASTRKDLVIIGGGPAGLSLATALKSTAATSSLDLALVEGQNLERLRNWAENADPSVYENRVSSLTPRSVKFLEKIGAWDHLVQDRVMPYDEMKVWDGVSNARIDFDPFLLGESSDIAYMVENSNLQQGLLKRLQELGFQDIYDGQRVKEISAAEPGAWPQIDLENGDEFSARLVVGADGQNSPVRHFAKIESRGWDYQRFGVVASLELEYDNFRAVAYQRFLPTGPIALLPLPDGHATLVWSTLPERAKWLQAVDADIFPLVVDAGFRLEPVDLDYIFKLDPKDSEEIKDQIEWRLSETVIEDEANLLPVHIAEVQPGSRAGFPLRMRHADTYVADRVALVGDAAHATHPLAGQGLNMGQRDAELLVDALVKAVERGLDIGSMLALEPYWKAAYLPNHVKLGVVDKLHKLYGTDCWPIVQARSLGLDLVNSSDTIKSYLMGQASN